MNCQWVLLALAVCFLASPAYAEWSLADILLLEPAADSRPTTGELPLYRPIPETDARHAAVMRLLDNEAARFARRLVSIAWAYAPDHHPMQGVLLAIGVAPSLWRLVARARDHRPFESLDDFARRTGLKEVRARLKPAR
ncbi:MAG: hypothetical protein HYY25_10270 [Candidatus Wallbacteria bacterium]|nr:hypothetical protein [Candidatus Wallbacteria bacterium]